MKEVHALCLQLQRLVKTDLVVAQNQNTNDLEYDF